MPAIGKQRRTNRNKVFRKRRERFAVNSKPKPFTALSGKLKNNNNLLAKALSAQKQETQLLFSQKIELTSQLQALTMACNKRDLVLSNIQNNAKEMLSMLVTMTNFVTNTIMGCQELSHKADGYISRPSTVSATKRESTRRLSTKSPAKGVVKPMVSGHTITKPTINLHRVNIQRVKNLMDLSVINEASPDRVKNNQMHTAAFSSANRLGYEGQRRRRLPERIPVEYVEPDDDDGDALGRQEPRLSARFSRRISNSLTRKRSGNPLTDHIRSPSVSLCDVSKLLQNSQTINVRTLQDSQVSGDFNRLSNTVGNISQRISNGDTSSVNIVIPESEGAPKGLDKTVESPPAQGEVSFVKSRKTVKKTNGNLETDPMEGPSWLLNSPAADSSITDIEEKTVEIFRRKHITRKLDSSESEAEAGNNSDDDSMEFTECIKPVSRPPEIFTSELVNKQTDVNSNLSSHIVQNEIDKNNYSNERDLEDEDEQCANFEINHSTKFVTDRRQRYISSDSEDDDTIMLQLSKGAKTSIFDINDFHLPVANCPIIARVEPNDSEPEVTTTIQVIPQNYVPPNLVDDNVDDRVSNFCSLQLPKIDDELVKTKKTKRTTKRKPRKNVTFNDTDSSNSDRALEPKKKMTTPAKPTNVKDPSSVKVVLQKLNDTHMKIRSTTPDQSLVDITQDLDGPNQRTFETGNSELITDSNSSTHSVSESRRPRRQKAPTNLKEPSLHNGHFSI